MIQMMSATDTCIKMICILKKKKNQDSKTTNGYNYSIIILESADQQKHIFTPIITHSDCLAKASISSLFRTHLATFGCSLYILKMNCEDYNGLIYS